MTAEEPLMMVILSGSESRTLIIQWHTLLILNRILGLYVRR